MKRSLLYKEFRKMTSEKQTALLVGMYQKYIMKAHRKLEILADFTWRDVTLDPEKGLVLDVAPAMTLFSIEERDNNLIDFAGVIYCLTTGEKTAEAMGWDAGRLIKQPVLREIVLTICGRNLSVEPLLKRLEREYTGEDDFFNDYTTVDELDGMREFQRTYRVEEARKSSAGQGFATQPFKTHWTERWGWKMLGNVVVANVLIMVCMALFSDGKSSHMYTPSGGGYHSHSSMSIPLDRFYYTYPHLPEAKSLETSVPRLNVKPVEIVDVRSLKSEMSEGADGPNVAVTSAERGDSLSQSVSEDVPVCRVSEAEECPAE